MSAPNLASPNHSLTVEKIKYGEGINMSIMEKENFTQTAMNQQA